MKALCWKMDVNGMGFLGIEQVTAVAHTSVISLVRQIEENLPDAYDPECIPEVGELNELETFLRCWCVYLGFIPAAN
jgi:hypothetical protein